MQEFTLIKAFRDWEIGTVFTKNEDGTWSSLGEFQNVPSHVCDTLLDVGGYFEDTTPVVWTPAVGDTVYVITGAGEVQAKEFTDSAWFRKQKAFMGYYATRGEADNYVDFVVEALNLND